MSSVNEPFFFISFPRLLFCLLVVSIISRVMSHIFVDIFPSHPPSLFLSPTHTHTNRWAKLVFILTLSYTHIHSKSSKKSPTALICSSIIFFFSLFYFQTPCLFCAQCYLCLFCVLEKRKQHFYTIYVNKLLLLQF